MCAIKDAKRSKDIINLFQEIDESPLNPLHDYRHPLHKSCVQAYLILQNELSKLSEKNKDNPRTLRKRRSSIKIQQMVA